jgi:subtilisin family serine protease
MANAIAPGSADKLSKATKPLPPGLEIAGNYMGGGNWRMQFDDRSAMMSCGDLDQEQRFYTIGIVNNQAAIKVDITPKPFVLYMRPDGTLADAGPVVVDGRVVAGSGSVTTSNGKWVNSQTTMTQKLTPMEAQQYAGQSNLHTDGQYYTLTNTNNSTTYQPGTTTYSGPNYVAKTETCSIAILKSGGKTQVDALKGLTESMLGGESAPPTPPGLRMHGAYVASTGFSVEFFPESAILGCGQAARAYPYSVLASGGQALVRVDAPGHPVAMALKPDNSLDPGSGQYEVQGRRITGKNADGDFVFGPLNQTCTLGVLKPGAIPTAPSSSSMAPANTSGTGMPTNRTATGDAVLALSVFPPQSGAANPLAAHALFLLKDSFNNVLMKSGLQAPAGKTPCRVGTWPAKRLHHNVPRRSPACSHIWQAW